MRTPSVNRTIRTLPAPQAEVVSGAYFHTLYAWNKVITVFDGTFGQSVPMRQCLGIYRWRWTAEIAKWRWLRKHRTS